jgi:hypothetical protein
MDLDERWKRWCLRFDEAAQDIRTLFHNRHVWLSITQMWQENAEAIELNTIVQNWHVRLYVNTQCTGIRRECDANMRTSSLENCLRELAKYPKMMDRSRFEAGIEANPEIPAEFKTINKQKFDAFALSPQSADLDQAKIETDIRNLRAAADTTRTYTNKIVAHREFTTAKITLAWADLDLALNTVGEVLKRYYTLWNTGVIKGNLTPELPLGWERPYQAAWRPQDFTPLSARPLDTYVHSTSSS